MDVLHGSSAPRNEALIRCFSETDGTAPDQSPGQSDPAAGLKYIEMH
jgi:hypothetical protein